jgi:hypothetical protein
MKAKKILNSDIKDIRIASLPSRPTAPKSHGGEGYSAKQMKEAFDKLPLYVVERYNELIDDITDEGSDSLAYSIPSGIKDGHTLGGLFDDVKSGELATYFSFLGKSLLSHVLSIYVELDALKERVAYLEKKEGDTK